MEQGERDRRQRVGDRVCKFLELYRVGTVLRVDEGTVEVPRRLIDAYNGLARARE